MDDLLRIGVVINTHGLQGEVKVFPTTDDVKRFKDCKDVVLVTKKGNLNLTVESTKFFKNQAIVKFKEFNNINDVEGFRQCDLMVTRENAVPLKEGEYFLCDIMDASVEDEEGNKIGVITEILQTGANDVYVVKTADGKEVLFPVIPDCVKKIDTENKNVVVHVMDGLME